MLIVDNASQFTPSIVRCTVTVVLLVFATFDVDVTPMANFVAVEMLKIPVVVPVMPPGTITVNPAGLPTPMPTFSALTVTANMTAAMIEVRILFIICFSP